MLVALPEREARVAMMTKLLHGRVSADVNFQEVISLLQRAFRFKL